MRKIVFLIFLFNFYHLTAAPESKVIDYWNTSDQTSNIQIDHSPWSLFLNKYLINFDGTLSVKYGSVTSDDLSLLNSYLDSLEKIFVTSLNRDEQFVYWINLYNALTVKVILDNYPVKSIKQIKPGGLFSSGPWDEPYLTIEGQPITLNNIEHGILRPIWGDSRVHYAVNCASRGCPPLQAEAFTTENVELLLEQAERDFLNSYFGVRLEGHTLILSSIFKWFREDFGESEDDVLEYIESINPTIRGLYKRVKYSYDWDINSYD